MKPRSELTTIHFIQPQLSHSSGGSIYNLEIVKRLEQEARGQEFVHALSSPVSELIEHFKAWAHPVVAKTYHPQARSLGLRKQSLPTQAQKQSAQADFVPQARSLGLHKQSLPTQAQKQSAQADFVRVAATLVVRCFDKLGTLPNALPSSCVFVLDGLYLTNPEFKASLEQFLPYAQRIYLMLHYLESMNTYYSAQEKQALWTGEKSWLEAVRGIIVPSFQLRDYLTNQGLDNEKITVAFPGTEKAQACHLPNPKERSENPPLSLISVGTLSRRKGQLDLLKMLAQMPVKNFILHLVGDGEQESSYTEEIRAVIRRSQMQDSVILHGNVPQPAIFELLPQCDLYISPSTYESYSMATAEAVANGLPVLAYATGAISDWIEDGGNGILIELGKPEQFFNALKRLLTERNELNQLRKNALACTTKLSFNSWDKTYRDFLQAFNSVTNG